MDNNKLRFKTELLLEKKTATGLAVPPEIVEQLGSGKKPAVKVTINGYTYPSTVATMGGVFMLPVSAQVREKTGINSGDMVEVIVELDTQPRVVEVPEDFQAALDSNPVAKQYFESISNSNKKYFIGPIEQAKTPETRIRRIEKAISDLELQKKI